MSVSLRLILLIIGSVIIALITIDALRRSSKKRRLQEQRLERDQSHVYGKPIDDLSADLDDILVGEGPDLLQEYDYSAPRKKASTRSHEEPVMLFDDYDDEPSFADSFDRVGPALEPAKPRVASRQPAVSDVIVLHVMADDDYEYEGRSLVRLLVSLGLRFGEKGIFHRHESHHLKSPVLFNVASAVEPGIFNVKNMDNLSTPGVTLFFAVDQVDDPLSVYENMLDTANRLAESLDAQVLDEKRALLGPQAIALHRRKILDFMQQEEVAEEATQYWTN